MNLRHSRLAFISTTTTNGSSQLHAELFGDGFRIESTERLPIKMPHAVSPEEDAADSDVIDQFIGGGEIGYGQLVELDNRDLDLGDKADDAIDFEDIDDDDLADDEEITPTRAGKSDDDLANDEEIAPGGVGKSYADIASKEDGATGRVLISDDDVGNNFDESAFTADKNDNDTRADADGLGNFGENVVDQASYSFDLEDDLFGEKPEPTNIDSNYDDLFGEDLTNEPEHVIQATQSPTLLAEDSTMSAVNDSMLHSTLDFSEAAPLAENNQASKPKDQLHPTLSSDAPKSAYELRLEQEQLALFQAASRKLDPGTLDLPPAPTTNAELFEVLYPNFERDKPPRFSEILETKRAVYVGKVPSKPPKPLIPTKVTLELQQDQEKSFKIPQTSLPDFATKEHEAEQNGIILTITRESSDLEEDDILEPEIVDEDDTLGGRTWADIKQLCESWDDTPSLTEDDSDDAIAGKKRPLDEDEGLDVQKRQKTYHFGPTASPTEGDDLVEIPTRMKRRIGDQEDDHVISLNKRQKTHHFDLANRLMVQNDFPSFDDPEEVTRRIAQKVILDENDPYLLLDFQQPSTPQKQARKVGDLRRVSGGRVTKDLSRRYNISNDAAYDLLKENHSNKVRSTLGNMSVEHSLPAIKLQYPFYKDKLSAREARSFHRPTINFRPGEAARFSKPRSQKRKHMKGKDAQSLFQTAHDLSMGDNSHSVLLEYSEENPFMLSNFGMGNRLINYYRRKDIEDNARPKADIGETQVLLPQDKSPFSIFGEIEKGETTLTLQNFMFRAPVFKHNLRPTDFVIVRSSTGTGGSQWYLKNFENLYVVGQEFPSVEVPGAHSRKSTDVNKRRLRAVAYRIYAHNQQSGNFGTALLTNEMIRAHQPNMDVTSLRSKMREFMDYERLQTTWKPKPGNTVPDLQSIRSWIKPEDVCLMDSMQVGQRHLQDAGYNKALNEEMEVEEEEVVDGQSIDEQLAPWQATKNFLNACQGKAMLELYGQGDPSGRGEAFSFIKTSMKGGFKAIGESVADKIKAKNQKEHGGHAYNVAAQQRQYEEAIRQIWTAQKNSLSNENDYSDIESDIDGDEDMDTSFHQGRTPRSEVGTPAAIARRDDDTISQFSRVSGPGKQGKVLRIVRYETDKYGNEQKNEEIIHDPKVIREYLKRRKTLEVAHSKYGSKYNELSSKSSK